MSERFTKLFGLEKDLCCEGAPLLICAGSLLQDSYTKNMLAQIKYKNIGSKIIKSAKVSITMIDNAGQPIPGAVDYQYMDLSAERDGEFGQKTAVVLHNSTVRSFLVNVTEVLFDDGSKWVSTGDRWLPLKSAVSLTDALGSEELATQYRIRYGPDCIYEPVEDRGLWVCTCGAVNSQEERSCHKCRRVLAALKDINTDSLQTECSKRLKNEEEQQEADNTEAEGKKKKRKKAASVIIPAAVILALIIAFVPGAVRRSNAYDSAEALLSEGRYDEARAAFSSLGNYKDSRLMAEKEVSYQEALKLMDLAEAGDEAGLVLIGVTRSSLSEDDNVAWILYKAAAEHFTALGDYKKSAENLAACRAAMNTLDESELKAGYEAAQKLLSEQRYCQARDAFLELGEYKDSRDMAKEAIYQKAVSLFGFLENHDVKYLYAILSTDTDTESLASIPQEKALEMGSGYITDLKAAIGRDKEKISMEDTAPDGFMPYSDALIQLFESLGNYRDSRQYITKIQEICDVTREFFSLVGSGDVPAAFDWLSAYEDEFENRERWLELLELYRPLCGSWEFSGGSADFFTFLMPPEVKCSTFRSSVIISGLDEKAVLHIVFQDDDSLTLDFTADPGIRDFALEDEDGQLYYVSLNNAGRLAFSFPPKNLSGEFSAAG